MSAALRTLLILPVLVLSGACSESRQSPPSNADRTPPATEVTPPAASEAGVDAAPPFKGNCGLVAACPDVLELDRQSGVVTPVRTPLAGESEKLARVGCGATASVDGVTVRIACVETDPVGYAPPSDAYQADVSVTIVEDPQHPARNGTVIPFPRHVGFYDDAPVWFWNTGGTLQMMAVFVVYVK